MRFVCLASVVLNLTILVVKGTLGQEAADFRPDKLSSENAFSFDAAHGQNPNFQEIGDNNILCRAIQNVLSNSVMSDDNPLQDNNVKSFVRDLNDLRFGQELNSMAKSISIHCPQPRNRRSASNYIQNELIELDKLIQRLKLLQSSKNDQVTQMVLQYQEKLRYLLQMLIRPLSHENAVHINRLLSSFMKRRFNSWGGKRSTFHSWGGKRGADLSGSGGKTDGKRFQTSSLFTGRFNKPVSVQYRPKLYYQENINTRSEGELEKRVKEQIEHGLTDPRNFDYFEEDDRRTPEGKINDNV